MFALTRSGKMHFSTGFCRFLFILIPTISIYEPEIVAVAKELVHQKDTQMWPRQTVDFEFLRLIVLELSAFRRLIRSSKIYDQYQHAYRG
jgi:hypothetical protein